MNSQLRPRLPDTDPVGLRHQVAGHFERRSWPYFFLMPGLILAGAVVVYPVLSGVLMSLQRVQLLRPGDTGFVGIDNFVAFLRDSVAWTALENTVIWVVGGLAVQFCIGMAIALLLNGTYRGVNIVRVLVLLPWFLPGVVVAHMWTMLLDPRTGVVNDVLMRIGLLDQGKAWFADPNTALFAVMAVEAWWSTPFFALFLLAGLQSIPGDLIDAVKVDGATGVQQFRYLTLPLLRPVIVVVTSLQAMRLANSPDLLNILTAGGPGRSTFVLSLYAFRTAYASFNFGYAAAISVVLLVVLALFTIVYIRVSGVGRD